MFELKRLSRDGVPAALKKAERYRLLNEPWHAESICRDVLEVDHDQAEALVTLLLALTDQFATAGSETLTAARALLPRLPSEYERTYYAGIVCERWAQRLLDSRAPGSGPVIYHWLREAMAWYEQAESLRLAGDDDPILRWNTCARLIHQHPDVRPQEEQRAEIQLE